MKKKRSYEQNKAAPTAITPVEYGSLQTAYEHFNAELFDNKLPNVFITYQRRAQSYGYFHAKRFVGRDGKEYHGELALNPDGFINRSDRAICSTLGHEMVHVLDEKNGTAPKRHYHHKIWAAEMKAIGLYPSNTGMVGGRETGAHMSHYVIEGGPFAKSYERLSVKGWKLNLQSAPLPNPTAARKSKTKFTCGECGQNAWGKPDLKVTCTPCGAEMRSTADAEPSQSYDEAA
jgi:hypothetical protein